MYKRQNVSLYLHEAIKEGKTVLLEGQLGSMKDPDHGIYPMVTSSSTLAGYGAVSYTHLIRMTMYSSCLMQITADRIPKPIFPLRIAQSEHLCLIIYQAFFG